MTRKQYADITLEVAFLIFLNKHENAPPVKSGALYQNTVPLPHLKHRLIQCVNSVFRFLCPESLAAQHLQFLTIAVCFMVLKKRGFESPQ